MVQAFCIEKEREYNNKILAYKLSDWSGQTLTFSPEELKDAIKNKTINVVNLTLTSDNRLIDKLESTFKSMNITTKDNTEARELLKNKEQLAKRILEAIDIHGKFNITKQEYYKDKIAYGAKGYSIMFRSYDAYLVVDTNYKNNKVKVIVGIYCKEFFKSTFQIIGLNSDTFNLDTVTKEDIRRFIFDAVSRSRGTVHIYKNK